MSHKRISLLIILALLCAGCSVQVNRIGAATPTALIITSTLPAAIAPLPSQTPLPPPPQPTVVPVEGITSTPLNVRSEPSTVSDALGIIPANTKVQIVGKDPGEGWWQILYQQGKEGKGWVTAKYVTTASRPEVPVIGGVDINPVTTNVAVIQQKINIRSGPGTGFNAIGTLNAKDVVNLSGKDANGAWLQIEFAAGPAGKGWINAAFAQTQGTERLPIITEAGDVIGTGTPTEIPLTPTATLMPAWTDGDSATRPIANVIFSATGTHTLIYNGDVSAPAGDTEDWIAFTSYSKNIFASLTCTGSHLIKLEIIKNDVPASFDIVCGTVLKEFSIEADAKYLIHIEAQDSANGLQYTNYTVTIQTR